MPNFDKGQAPPSCHFTVPKGFPGGSDGKEFTRNAGDLGSIPGSEDPLEMGTQPTPVFLSVEFHRQRRLEDCSP